ncbi:MAG TPA: hypothetical protein VFV32_04065 [Acidimicrobiales bacterium]|jgi:hypothetical protein|nr:hypothetical protein [Acidimicrobiales bacterium]
MIRRLARSRSAASIALAGGIALAGFGVAAAADSGDGGVPAADPDDLALVERFAGAVTTFDSGQVEADIERILALGTPAFAEEFRSTMGESFVAQLQASGSVSRGEIVAGPTLQRVDDDTVVFFVVVNQQITAPSAAPAGGEGAEGSGEGTQPAPQSRVVRVGLLVQVDRQSDLVSSVQVL